MSVSLAPSCVPPPSTSPANSLPPPQCLTPYLRLTPRYVPLFLVLFLFFSGCFRRRKRRDGMALSAWLLLGPNAAYYWSESVTANRMLNKKQID